MACLALMPMTASLSMAAQNGLERQLGTLPTTEITSNHSVNIRYEHRFEEPISPPGENNLFYNLLGMDGEAHFYFDISYGLTQHLEATLSREQDFKTYGFETKWSALRQGLEIGSIRSPISLSLAANIQVRTERSLPNDKRFSGGGNAIASRCFKDKSFEWLLEGMSQSNTRIAEPEAPMENSLALGTGIIWRLDRVNLFAEAAYPLSVGDWSYRENFSGRADWGIPPLGAGMHFHTSKRIFSLIVTNYTSMLAANFLAGAHAPSASRMMEWRLGFNITQGFPSGE